MFMIYLTKKYPFAGSFSFWSADNFWVQFEKEKVTLLFYKGTFMLSDLVQNHGMIISGAILLNSKISSCTCRSFINNDFRAFTFSWENQS